MTPRTLLVSLVYTASLAACSGGGPIDPDFDAGAGGGGGGGTNGGGAGGGLGGGSGGGGMTCACSLPNAVAACADAGCALVKCHEGFRDLDRDLTNGCEATCQPLAVTTSGNLDFDAKVVSLSGLVTQQGGPLGQPRGVLRFELAGSQPVDVVLPASGAATYAVKLFAGQTRVSYVPAGGTAALLKSAPLTASGALDFDVPGAAATGTPIVVSGVLKVNGAAPAARPGGSRALVRFVPAGGGPGVPAVVPGTGAAAYSATLAPGVWDVVVEGDSACGGAGAVVPCHASVRKKGLTLNVSGSLDLDLPIVSVGGTVNANGQPLAAVPTGVRGNLALIGADGAGPVVTLAGTGAPAWSTLVYAGSYDVVVSRPTCGGPGPLPCGTHVALKNVALTAAGALDLDLKVYELSGQVLANGQPLKASPGGAPRGTLSFGEGTGPGSPLGASGAATYQTKLYAGTYDATLSNSEDCADGALPCGVRKVKSVTVSTSGALDVDVDVVKVSGALTVNGAAMGGSPTNTPRAELVFVGPTAAPLRLTASGAATFSQTLYPGTYGVQLANASDCANGPVPCQVRVLETAKTLTADATLAWDLPVVEVAGAVTHNGVAPAGSTSPRGELLFRDATGSTVGRALTASGAATYAVRLYPATYTVLFRNRTDCPANDASPFPCTGDVPLAASVAVTASGARDFDVKSVTLTGTVTVNGAQMAVTGATSRGRMAFAGFGLEGSPLIRGLADTGPATWRARLLQGAYDVALEGGASCGAAGPLPCQQLVLAGCEAP